MQNRLSRNGWEDCYSYRNHVTEWNTTDMGLLQHTVAHDSKTSGSNTQWRWRKKEVDNSLHSLCNRYQFLVTDA